MQLRQPCTQDSSPLLKDDADATLHVVTSSTRNNLAHVVGDNSSSDAAVTAQQARQLSDALDRKLSLRADTVVVTSSTSRDRHLSPRFWSPSYERRRDEVVRPTAWASMQNFHHADDLLADFRLKTSPSPSEPEVEESSSRAESEAERHCTRQLCCKYCLKFVAFLFSTLGSCCLMVGYVILGGLTFCDPRRTDISWSGGGAGARHRHAACQRQACRLAVEPHCRDERTSPAQLVHRRHGRHQQLYLGGHLTTPLIVSLTTFSVLNSFVHLNPLTPTAAIWVRL